MMEQPKKEKQTSQDGSDMITARSFTSDEMKELNRYIQNSIPYSVLEQIFPLTEALINKVEVFTIVYRITNSCKNYVRGEDTKRKLQSMLDIAKDVYNDLYKSLLRYREGGFGSSSHYDNLTYIMCDVDKRTIVDNLIDAFLIFAEKLSFFSIDNIAGVETSKKDGEMVVDKILGEKAIT